MTSVQRAREVGYWLRQALFVWLMLAIYWHVQAEQKALDVFHQHLEDDRRHLAADDVFYREMDTSLDRLLVRVDALLSARDFR